MFKRAYHFWVYECCYADRRMLLDRYAPLFVLTLGVAIFTIFFCCSPSQVPTVHRMHASLFGAWSMMLFIGLLDCGDTWSEKVRQMTNNRRWAYVAIASPFIFMWLGMSLYRLLS